MAEAWEKLKIELKQEPPFSHIYILALKILDGLSKWFG